MILPADLPDDWAAEIEAYYAGELSPESERDLRDRLNGDPALAAAAAQHEALYRRGLQPERPTLVERERLRESLRSLERELPPVAVKANEPPRRMRLWLAIAASLLLPVLLWLFLARPDPNAGLMADHFFWLPRQDALLGPDEERDGRTLYDVRDYEAAYPSLRDSVAAGSLDSVNLLYAGVAAIGSGHPAEAREMLTNLLDTGRYPLEEDAIRYYLALAELMLGQDTAAEAQLRAMTGQDPELSVRADRLLQKLREGEGES
ncbi:tetratricopeptide repeat protein [Neolewinella litorea]|uniref:Tetratricopeptide repeat protein n=1 Tax=Neolewinella litorea TaxID=2562452 RepID=A0A4S4NLN4_9BACT|nr:hypothetical protein [Neolewinella litorea]THH40702.1 hypothetical protein E4021_08205 [Neolewinella litorea]